MSSDSTSRSFFFPFTPSPVCPHPHFLSNNSYFFLIYLPFISGHLTLPASFWAIISVEVMDIMAGVSSLDSLSVPLMVSWESLSLNLPVAGNKVLFFGEFCPLVLPWLRPFPYMSSFHYFLRSRTEHWLMLEGLTELWLVCMRLKFHFFWSDSLNTPTCHTETEPSATLPVCTHLFTEVALLLAGSQALSDLKTCKAMLAWGVVIFDSQTHKLCNGYTFPVQFSGKILDHILV